MSDVPFICCGAMSDEIIKILKDISSKYNKKISLVCSRNQVDSKSNGGGYVNKFKYSSSLKNYQVKTFYYLVIIVDHTLKIRIIKSP